ncbi:Similar to Putative ankyrin repeat protein RF_0381; acc. no. Q4UMH6 [Pyronema omphalodes CBS 100304]|uniref:Similar to Putative ankyrin repeat protein RF_0381 acc. no. Q4UMH6 n=1 Tax=Pyronema omphalodes (strain CBS 100304) TaxID=1076935 RepID=U4LUM7_PYROM|nr:Similar to Putative ankyrin repeat protein RF_0381; acc. no. Q4UMH6 [Pyronema omphalodes CBS 100304]
MPLCYAAEAENLEKAEILLGYNADIRLKDNQGRCPLLRAASAGQYKMIRTLLKRGADIHQADNYGQTALHRAAAGSQDALRLVLELKVLDINSRDRDNRTALFLAAKTDRVDCVRIQLEQDGIDLDSLDNDGCTPSSGAVVSPYGRGDSAFLLLKKGANPEIKDKNGRTTLSLAVEHLESHNPIVNLLLERKEVDIESRCNHGRTPLQWAMISWKEITEYVRPLLDKGADVTVKGKDGRTVLSLAIDKVYNVEIMDIIIERLDKAYINSRNNDGRTPFLLAAKKGDMRSMVLLLRKGAGVQAKDKNGVSAMMHAALSRMKKSADFNAKENSGETVLLQAIGIVDESISLLIE